MSAPPSVLPFIDNSCAENMLYFRGSSEYNHMTQRRRLLYAQDVIETFGYVAADSESIAEFIGAQV
jgi:hypothetical protein